MISLLIMVEIISSIDMVRQLKLGPMQGQLNLGNKSLERSGHVVKGAVKIWIDGAAKVFIYTKMDLIKFSCQENHVAGVGRVLLE